MQPTMNFPFLSEEAFNTLVLEAQELSEASNRKGTGILSLPDFARNVILLYNQLQIEDELKKPESLRIHLKQTKGQNENTVS